MIFSTSPQRRSSLRQRLLLWAVPGALFLLVAGGLAAYTIGVSATRDAYDRGLLDAATEVEEQMMQTPEVIPSELPPHAQRVLLVEPADRVYFRIQSRDGHRLAGSEVLPLPATLPATGSEVFYDLRVGTHPVRVVALGAAEGATILVAATLVKRDSMIREFVTSMLLPGIALLSGSFIFIWVGLRTVLAPLDELRQQLALRSPTDLSPIDVQSAPRELQPVLDEINELLVRLGESIETQRHFVSEAAHQLRTPIAALQAQVESAVHEAAPEERQRLGRILAAAHRLAHLVRQLLALARAEPAGLATSASLDLATLIRTRVEFWLPEAIARDIDLGFELDSASIAGTPLLIEELLGNLVDNALAYTPRGGRVTIRCGRDGSETFLQVEDSGPGIPPDQREHVFERFVRLSEDTSGGCGLGLAIVRRIATQHGATIRIDDADSGGTRVEVRFPAT